MANEIHTIDNPKIVTWYGYFEGKESFSGVVKDRYDSFAFYLNGKLHRNDGPAYMQRNGLIAYYQHGQAHRDDGPAVISDISNSYYPGKFEVFFPQEKFKYYAYYNNGKLHRLDGPAIVFKDDYVQYWVDGVATSEFVNEKYN